MWRKPKHNVTMSMEEIRKRARLLVIDDQAFTAQQSFTRDGYHVERWSTIRNLPQLTDGHFDLILLDLQGVGLNESPQRQGLGILEHVKKSNPTQLVIAYSAQPSSISNRNYFALADDVLDKGQEYLLFKEAVDSLLTRRFTVGYFIAKMNQELGDSAADAPKAVSKAINSVRSGTTGKIRDYLTGTIQDEKKIEHVVTIVASAIKVLSES